MLIVGEAVHNLSKPGVKTNIVSILVNDSNVEKLHKILNVEKEPFKKVSEYADLYKQKSEKGKRAKKFLIMRVGHNLYLDKFIKKGQASCQLRMATPAINYAFSFSMANIRHDDPINWLTRIYHLKEGRKAFEKTYKNLKERGALWAYGRNIVDYFSQMDGMKASLHEPADFEIYDKFDILKYSSCESEYSSTYLKSYGKLAMKTQDNFYIKSVWDKFTFQEKLKSMVDRCILDAINEDFLAELWCYNRFPSANLWFKLYLKAVMHVGTSGVDQDYFMKEFVIDNIGEMVSGYDRQFFQQFILAHHANKLIPKIKLNK